LQNDRNNIFSKLLKDQGKTQELEMGMTVKTAPSINFGEQSELSSLPNPLSTLTNVAPKTPGIQGLRLGALGGAGGGQGLGALGGGAGGM